MVPLHHVYAELRHTDYSGKHQLPGAAADALHRVYEFGAVLRKAIDALPENIALLGTGGTSHWPCTPDSGKINIEWDEDF